MKKNQTNGTNRNTIIIEKSIHPIIVMLIPAGVVRGSGVYLQLSMGERRGPAWTGYQSIAGQHRDKQDKQPFTHTHT